MGLELYGKIEDLFLDREAANILWSKFIEILLDLNVTDVLDIGCGSGEFCKMAKEHALDVKGIDLSKIQIQRAKENGCECEVSDVCSVNGKYDAAVAIFDVINYMDDNQLKSFLKCVEKICDFFICDANSYFAMNDLAIGTLKAEDENRFGILYSDFEDDVLITEITLFEKEGECYKKTQKNIIQYYHSVEKILKFTKMKLKRKIPISLYESGEIEKWILVFEQ